MNAFPTPPRIQESPLGFLNRHVGDGAHPAILQMTNQIYFNNYFCDEHPAVGGKHPPLVDEHIHVCGDEHKGNTLSLTNFNFTAGLFIYACMNEHIHACRHTHCACKASIHACMQIWSLV